MSVETPSLRDQGLEALQSGDLKKAVDFFSKAVLLDHNDAEAKVLLGMAYSQSGMHSQATRALQTAVEMDPKNSNFRYNLGAALENAGDAVGALHVYRDALQLNRENVQAKTRLQTLGQSLGPQVNQMLNGARPASAGPPPFAPPPQSAIPNSTDRVAAEDDGMVQCEACNKKSPMGMVCIHCMTPLPPPPPPKPLPAAQRAAPGVTKSKIKLPPHRANTILALGIGGFFIPFLAIAAISMGGIDLVLMDRKDMDDSGLKVTDFGRKLGFAALGAWGMAILILFVLPAILKMYKSDSSAVPPGLRPAHEVRVAHRPAASLWESVPTA